MVSEEEGAPHVGVIFDFQGHTMIHAAPGQAGAPLVYKARYDNFIGGQWTPPIGGEYFDVITPINGQVYTQAARSHAQEFRYAFGSKAGAGYKHSKCQGLIASLALN